MWFLISIVFSLWLIGYITFGSRAYLVDGLLVVVVALYIYDKLRGRRRAE
jgi:hypothetical protein